VHELVERLDHHRQRFTMMQDELLPARELARERVQQRVNFMFDDVFDLLAAKQEELADWQKAVVALGDYWKARAELTHAVAGELPGGEPGTSGYFETSMLDHDAGSMGHEPDGHGDHGAHQHMNHGEGRNDRDRADQPEHGGHH
jgi:hypothetical protein